MPRSIVALVGLLSLYAAIAEPSSYEIHDDEDFFDGPDDISAMELAAAKFLAVMERNKGARLNQAEIDKFRPSVQLLDELSNSKKHQPLEQISHIRKWVKQVSHSRRSALAASPAPDRTRHP